MIFVEVKNQWMPCEEAILDKDYFIRLLDSYWSVEVTWVPFNSASFEDSEGGEGRPLLGDWDPAEDDVWVRTMNLPDVVRHILSVQYL